MADIKPETGGIVSLIALDMDAYSNKYGNKAVRKNVTIPAWLNTFAEQYDINFSRALQNMLMKAYEEIRKAEDEANANYELNDKTAAKIMEAAGITEASAGVMAACMVVTTLLGGGLGFHYGAERIGITVIPTSSGNTLRQLRFVRFFTAKMKSSGGKKDAL